MYKSCKTCRFGSYNNSEHDSCTDNPESPTHNIGSCCNYSYWQPIPYKPSEMDLLALESMRDSKEIYYKLYEKTKKGIVLEIRRSSFKVSDGSCNTFFVFEIYREPPKPQWKDLTRGQVFKHCLEKLDVKVWTWNFDNGIICCLEKRQLCGYDENLKYCYITDSIQTEHASLTKPI